MRIILEISDDTKEILKDIHFSDEFVEGYLKIRQGHDSYKKRFVIDDVSCTFHMYKVGDIIHIDFNGAYCLAYMPETNKIIIKDIPLTYINKLKREYPVREFLKRIKRISINAEGKIQGL